MVLEVGSLPIWRHHPKWHLRSWSVELCLHLLWEVKRSRHVGHCTRLASLLDIRERSGLESALLFEAVAALRAAGLLAEPPASFPRPALERRSAR